MSELRYWIRVVGWALLTVAGVAAGICLIAGVWALSVSLLVVT